MPGIRVLGSNNTIGGTVAGASNLVSGNLGDGIVLEADDNAVSGNRIGVSGDGTTALGNGGSGVVVLGQGNTIGGTTSGARNVISGNVVRGVFLAGSGNFVFGNSIGTTADGKAAVRERWQRHLDRGGRQRDRRAVGRGWEPHFGQRP